MGLGYPFPQFIQGIGMNLFSGFIPGQVSSWEPNAETGPLAYAALHGYLSSEFLNDTPADKEPEAGAFSRTLGGKKGLEDSVEVFPWDAPAGIANRDSHLLLLAPKNDRDGPSWLGGMNGIGDEIDQDLSELIGIAIDRL